MYPGASSQESLRNELERIAGALWGAARIEALRPGLQNLARDLWLVAQQPLGPLAEIPDPFGAALPAPVGGENGTAV
ncbi:MAG: hypothetical protein EXR51_07925 [Dehalococcoidia bacterium]|nr:hypothetical protein [Dehalococcoidia bacterium]